MLPIEDDVIECHGTIHVFYLYGMEGSREVRCQCRLVISTAKVCNNEEINHHFFYYLLDVAQLSGNDIMREV